MKAKKKPLETRSLAALGLNAAQFEPDAQKTRILSLSFPPQRKVCKMVSGETAEEKAARLVHLLREEAGVL
jgi:electron transfer flavoprotein alpha/beta subunit